jgi:hypothetical protein
MAVSHPVFDMTFVAGANLATSQFRFVTYDATANMVKICGTADRPLGVLQNQPAAGEAATVRLLGTTKVSANGAFALHDELTVAASDGEVDTVTGSEAWAVGLALAAAGAAGDIVEMLLFVRPIGDADLATLLASVADGSAGADLVGATPITETGAANSVQEILEALVTALTAVADGSAGADLVGATPITETGAAATVQAILEALVTALTAVADGSAGADLVGATPITETGAANSVQEILEALVTALTAVADGSAGADLVGATPITALGAANSVQEQMEGLVEALQSETDQTSGGDFVHCTGIVGLTGDTVQELLESLKDKLDLLDLRVQALE